MGSFSQKNKSNSVSTLKKDLLDAQEVAVTLHEQNQTLQEQLLDTQDLVTQIYEKVSV